MERGLIVYPGSGTADGVQGEHVLIAPPVIWEEAQVSELVEKLSATLAEVFARFDLAA